jgi:hypothetical protein
MQTQPSSSGLLEVFNSELANLDLTDPRTQPQDDYEEPKEDAEQANRLFAILSKAQGQWFSLSMLAFTSLFIIIYSAYIYQALLSPTPRFGSNLLSASDTNLLVSILSQIFSEMVQLLAVNAFDSARWAFAARPGGTSMPTFFQLSSSTAWFSVLFLYFNDKFYNIWGLIRYSCLFH